jgi:hypothetical protein
MSFEVDGSTWTPKTALVHAQEILSLTNAALDSSSQIAQNTTNILWLLMLGIGNKFQTYDTVLEQAKNSFDLINCDDSQISNLLPVAGTSKQPAQYSALGITVVASSVGSVVLAAGYHVKVEGLSNYFLVQEDVTVAAGTSQDITVYADTLGAIEVAAGTVTGFLESVANLSSVTNPAAALPGNAEETTLQVRRRLALGKVFEVSVDGCAHAIASLPGITYAKVYFNVDPSNTTTIPWYNGTIETTLSVPPRTAQIVISGYSDSLAATYLARLLAPTQGARYQNYTLSSGQVVEVKYETTKSFAIFLHFVFDAVTTDTLTPALQTEAYNYFTSKIVSYISVGMLLTQQTVLEAMTDFPYATIVGMTLGKSAGALTNKVQLPSNTLPSFLYANCSFELG